MSERQQVRLPRSFRRPWLHSDRPVPRLVVKPLEQFLRLEAGSASLLMAAALAGLLWINLHPGSYDAVWEARISIEAGPLQLEEDLRHVVNELLMALFFFVVALEVKREVLFGSLRERATAAVPVAAAAGTMVGAAAAYVAVNLIGDGELRGWAIPIATDIAFALGALGLVGRRAPDELRAFLLTLAVVDDVGTIVVIGAFFTESVSLAWLAGGVGAVLGIVLLQRAAVRLLVPYVVLAGVLWLALYESGVHATIAGVVVGFLTPARALHSRQAVSEVIGSQLSDLSDSVEEVSEATMKETSRLAREGVSPLARSEGQLHPWSAYVVLPLFALANAGVRVSLDGVAAAFTSPVGLGILVGLLVGAPLGGLLLAAGIVRLGRARLQEGLDWAAVGGVAPLKGIGFTVAIFITLLAFQDEELQEVSKLAILVASAAAALVGIGVLLVRHLLLGRREGNEATGEGAPDSGREAGTAPVSGADPTGRGQAATTRKGTRMTQQLSDTRVAFLATDGVEQVELTEPRQAVEQAGGETVLVSLERGEIQGFDHLDKGERFQVDAAVSEADAGEFDALVLPGGVANPDRLRMDENAVRFVRAFFEAGKPVGVICHGPWTLVEADVVRGRTLTSYASLRTDIENAGGTWVDEEVCVDQGLVSSRSPKDLPAFCRKLVEEIAEGRHEGQAQLTADARRTD